MSELINNREYRKNELKNIILKLHEGKSVEEVKSEFENLIKDITPSEISDMEQALIMEGMPIEEVQRLCDVHASVFKGSIEEIHQAPTDPRRIQGHPVHTLMLENRALEELIEKRIKPHIKGITEDKSKESAEYVKASLQMLWEVDKHYSKKENLIFPYLEKYGITAPPKVMWGVDDEIRDEIKSLRTKMEDVEGHKDVAEPLEKLLDKVKEMIFKEETILFPMAIETLTEDEWLQIQEDGREIGYCLTEPVNKWRPEKTESYQEDKSNVKQVNTKNMIEFDSGILSIKQVESIFNHLPLDITFIDENDAVKYFSMGKERIFPRTKTIIGRDVNNCHPPSSVHVVEKIINSFKSGEKDSEEFWIKMGPVFAYIRYFAVRDNGGKYMGTLEVTQDVSHIQGLVGEKRLLSDTQ